MRIFDVRFSYPPPDSNFSGSVIVDDPWRPDSLQALNVMGSFQQTSNGIAAKPTMIHFDRGQTHSIRVWIFLDRVTDSITITPKGELQDLELLNIDQDSGRKLARVHHFDVSLRKIDRFPSKKVLLHVSTADSKRESIVSILP